MGVWSHSHSVISTDQEILLFIWDRTAGLEVLIGTYVYTELLTGWKLQNLWEKKKKKKEKKSGFFVTNLWRQTLTPEEFYLYLLYEKVL